MFGNVNVDYKPCKAVKQLRRACNYILGRNPDQIRSGTVKTAPDLYSAFDDDRDNFTEAVLLTRRFWDKPYDDTRSNLAYKISISFHPDEVLTYKEAFSIAKEFADNYFHSRGFDVLFAVHTDKQHIHAHFIVGNCNRFTGKSFRRNERDLHAMSGYFGKQCEEHGLNLSVRKDYYSKNPWQVKETFNEAQMTKKGKETFKAELREAIEKECRDPRNNTFDDVIKALWEHYHVETRIKGNTVSYRHPEYKNKTGELVSVRGSKLGEAFTKRGIENVLKELRSRSADGRSITGAQPRRLKKRNAQHCLHESSPGRRSTSGQGSGHTALDSNEHSSDTGELYEEYARKVRRAEQQAAESAERTERIRKKRSEQHR